MGARDSRIRRVRRLIDASPVRRGILREAYEWFTDFGELPDDDEHVAYEVVQQALRGGKEEPREDEVKVAALIRKGGIERHRREALEAASWPPSVRTMLFDEALFAHPALRDCARSQIAIEVAHGGDVENPAFGARHGMPMYGSVALHIGGWHKRLVLPPYEDQAERLLVRLDNIRGRIPQDYEHWSQTQAEAVVRFKMTGELPDDDHHLESLLTSVELDQLAAHKKGRDVSQAMALLNKVAWCRDGEWEEALKELCAMAAAGRLF